MADELAKKLLGLFAANGGVATVEQMGAVGLSEARLRRLVRRGVLRTVRRGVYVWRDVADKASSDPGRALALEVAAVNVQTSASLVASHQSAAVMHGLSMLDKVPEGSVSVTQAERAMGNSSTRSGVHIFTADVPEEHTIKMYGVPCTTVARTVVDLARHERFLAGVVVADDALPDLQDRTIAEADGKKKYDTRDEAVRQLRRDTRLREAGFEVVHFTWADIMYRPERVIANILAAFKRAERLR